MAQEVSWTMAHGGLAYGEGSWGACWYFGQSKGSVGAPMAIPEVRPLQVGPGLRARMILLGPWVIPTGNNVLDKG